MEGYVRTVVQRILIFVYLVGFTTPIFAQDTLFGPENTVTGGFTAVVLVGASAADLDGDVDSYILVGQTFSNFLGSQVMWLENDGTD